MARIRTIKPDFFRHEELFEAEKSTGLPLRVAFAGLFTAADREGRFKWESRALKLDCLPYDDVDFSRVLDALLARGFIVKYEVDGRLYGFLPSWKRHQFINNREAASANPEPNENNILTRKSRERHASTSRQCNYKAEGKGREGKGTETVASGDATSASFEDFWKNYPKRKGSNRKSPASKAFHNAVRAGADPAQIISGAKKYAEAEAANVGTPYIAMAATWLNQRGWEDYAPTAEDAAKSIQLDEQMKARGYIWLDGKWQKPEAA